MKMRKFVIFVTKNVNISKLKIKSNLKLGIILIIPVNVEVLQVSYVV